MRTTLTTQLALAALPLALARPASCGETPLERAVEAFQAGRYAAVVEASAVLERGAPDYPKLQYLVGESLLLLQRPAEARASFAEVLELRPRAVPALVGLARATARAGDLEACEQPLKTALELEPEDVQARTALGEVQMHRGALEQARATLAATHARAPDDLTTTQVYFEALLRCQDNPAAAELAEAWVARRPEHPLGHYLLAVIMERDGADAEAVAQYQLVLRKDPGFLDAHKNLAILCHTLSKDYTLKERVQLAYEHYRRYFELGGGDPTLRAMYDRLLEFKDQLLGS